MPRYFFHIRQAGGLIRDPDGSDLPDLTAARAEATQAARDVIADMLRRGERLDGQVFEITDETGHVLDRIAFRSVVRF